MVLGRYSVARACCKAGGECIWKTTQNVPYFDDFSSVDPGWTLTQSVPGGSPPFIGGGVVNSSMNSQQFPTVDVASVGAQREPISIINVGNLVFRIGVRMHINDFPPRTTPGSDSMQMRLALIDSSTNVRFCEISGTSIGGVQDPLTATYATATGSGTINLGVTWVPNMQLEMEVSQPGCQERSQVTFKVDGQIRGQTPLQENVVAFPHRSEAGINDLYPLFGSVANNARNFRSQHDDFYMDINT